MKLFILGYYGHIFSKKQNNVIMIRNSVATIFVCMIPFFAFAQSFS